MVGVEVLTFEVNDARGYGGRGEGEEEEEGW